jgi:hypothetical protein
MGRFGDEPRSRKVPLHVTVDERVIDALGKVRNKSSVSSMVNDILTIVIKQFDPGPSSPLIYELKELFDKHLQDATSSGDTQKVACIELLESKLLPYYDLAEVDYTRKTR